MTMRFFSIVVPAHNEEAIIDATLSYLEDLDYPKEKYEVIVVENGSHDATLVKAQAHASANIKVYHMKDRGVSRARNFGLSQIPAAVEWSIVIDADTFLQKDFLHELDCYLDARPKAAYGMATLTPDIRSLTARLYFWYRNTNMRLIKSMDKIHIVRRDLLAGNKYPEDFNFTEDLQYAEKLRGKGDYFFMPTHNVIVSARRFERLGYWHMFFKNARIGFLYAFDKKVLREREWEVVR